MCQKFVVFLLFVAIATAATSLRWKKYERTCIRETGVDKKFISQHRNQSQFLLYNPATRCYMACVLRALGGMKKNGHFNVKKIVKTFPEDLQQREKIIDAYKQCARKRGENFCDTTYKITKCILENTVIRTTFYPKDTETAGFLS